MSEHSSDLLVKPPIKRWVFILILLLLLLFYWTFAWFMEQIDLTVPLNNAWHGRFPNAPNLSPIIISIAELFSPSVLRHFIPVAAGWGLACLAAISLVRILYDLPNYATAYKFLGRLITGRSSDKPLAISSRTLETMRPEHVMLRVGGPGQLMVPPGEVAVTEINGRYYRLLSSGKQRLKPFEYVFTLISLRTQERHVTGLSVTTKDGISLTTDFTVTFHIDSGGPLPTRTQPFPYSPEAVEQAAYARSNAGPDKVFNWQDIPVNITTGILAGSVSQFTLDELLHPTGRAREPHYTLTQMLERKVRGAIEAIGLHLESIHIGRLELPNDVAQQYIQHWQANLDTRLHLALVEREASSLEEAELARAEAELIMIQAIIEGLENARLAGGATTMREVIALRLIEALEKMARQSQAAQPLPLTLLPQLENLRLQLAPDRQLLAGSQEEK